MSKYKALSTLGLGLMQWGASHKDRELKREAMQYEQARNKVLDQIAMEESTRKGEEHAKKMEWYDAEAEARLNKLGADTEHVQSQTRHTDATTEEIPENARTQRALLGAQTEVAQTEAEQNRVETEGKGITNELTREYGWQKWEAEIEKIDSEAALNRESAALKRKETEYFGTSDAKPTDLQKNAQTLLAQVEEDALKRGYDALQNGDPDLQVQYLEAVDQIKAQYGDKLDPRQVQLHAMASIGATWSRADMMAEAMSRAASLSRAEDTDALIYTQRYMESISALQESNWSKAPPEKNWSTQEWINAVKAGKTNKEGRPYQLPDNMIEYLARTQTMGAISSYRQSSPVGFSGNRQLGAAAGPPQPAVDTLGGTLNSIAESVRARTGGGGG